MSGKRIEDEFSDLEMSKQLKWKLRNQHKSKLAHYNYNHSDKGRVRRKRYYEKTKAEQENATKPK